VTATGGLTGQGRRVTAAAWGLNILGVAHGVWAPFEFDPIPTSLIACVAASGLAVAFALALPGWFALFDGKARGARSLGALFLAPLIGLIVRAAFTVQLLRLSSDLVPAVVGAVAGGAGAGLWWLRFGGNWRVWPLMGLLGLLVACALFEEIDQRLDHAAPQRFKVPVTDEFITRHKTTSYYITLPAWGPKHEPDSVRVSPNLYQNVLPGQDVCVVLHPGFLGAPWYTVDICPGPPG
jgi:hypothetical protein